MVAMTMVITGTSGWSHAQTAVTGKMRSSVERSGQRARDTPKVGTSGAA